MYSGTLVTRGTARGCVMATGERSALGRIGQSLAGIAVETTPIQRETRRVVKWVAVVGLALAAALAIAYWVMLGDWLHGLLAGLTLAMAILPEELPVVLTLFLGLGAWRLGAREGAGPKHSRRRTARRDHCVVRGQDGHADRQSHGGRRLWSELAVHDTAASRAAPLQEELHGVLEYAVLASHRRAFDPMESAIGDAGQRLLADTEHLHADWTLVDDYPLSPEMLAMSRVWQSPDQTRAADRRQGRARGHRRPMPPRCRAGRDRRQVSADGARRPAGAGRRAGHLRRGRAARQQHDFEFEFLGSSGWKTRCGPTCRRPSPNARPPASAS